MRQRRRGGVTVRARQSSQRPQWRRAPRERFHRRPRQGVRVDAEKERSVDRLAGAILADGVSDRENVPLVGASAARETLARRVVRVYSTPAPTIGDGVLSYDTSRPIRWISLMVAFLLGGACTRENPATASTPPVRGAPPPPPAALSRFSVPLAYDFSSMIALVERAVPRTLGSLDSVRMIGTDPALPGESCGFGCWRAPGRGAPWRRVWPRRSRRMRQPGRWPCRPARCAHRAR